MAEKNTDPNGGDLNEDTSKNELYQRLIKYELCQLFSGTDHITGCPFMNERTKWILGFVIYPTQEEARRAVNDFHGGTFKSMGMSVRIDSSCGKKMHYAIPARSDEMEESSLNDPPPSFWSTSSDDSDDSVLNYNRVMEACSLVTDKFFATTHGGIFTIEHIINDLDEKETATLLPTPLIKTIGTTSYSVVIESLKERESCLNIPPLPPL